MSTSNASSNLAVKIPSHRRMIEIFDIVDPQNLSPLATGKENKCNGTSQKHRSGNQLDETSVANSNTSSARSRRICRRITAVTDIHPKWVPKNVAPARPLALRRRITAVTDDHPEYDSIVAECARLGLVNDKQTDDQHSVAPLKVDTGLSSVTSEHPPVRHRRITATTDGRHWLDDRVEMDTVPAPGTPRPAA